LKLIFYFNILKNAIYSSDGKAEFASLLQSSVSHDPSEINMKKLNCYKKQLC